MAVFNKFSFFKKQVLTVWLWMLLTRYVDQTCLKLRGSPISASLPLPPPELKMYIIMLS